jgi:hypothetical protein
MKWRNFAISFVTTGQKLPGKAIAEGHSFRAEDRV